MLINTVIKTVNGDTSGYGTKLPIGAIVLNTERIIKYQGVDDAGTDDDTRVLYNLSPNDRREDSVWLVIEATLAETEAAIAAATKVTLAVTNYSGDNDIFSGDTETYLLFVKDFVYALAEGAADSYQYWKEGTFKTVELRVNQTLAALITAVTP